jgi:hypothetical protein
MAGKKHIKLKSARDIHRFLSKLINETYREETDIEKSRCLGYLAKIMLDSLTTLELEERISDLEKLILEHRNV